MSNPFESINERFDRIENILLEIIEKPQEESKSDNLTVKETAEYLKVSEQSIHIYIKKGFLKAHKIGRIYLIKRIDIEEALQEVKSLKYKRS